MDPFASAAQVPARKVWVIMATIWSLVALATAAALWELRGSALNSQARELDLLCLALGDNIDRGLSGVEQGLQSLRDELAGAGGAEHDLASTLMRRAQLMPLVDTVWLLDRDGHVHPHGGARHTLAPDTFAPPLTTLAPDAMALSGRFANGWPPDDLLAVSMKLNQAQGKGSAWIVADVSTRKLLGAFGQALDVSQAGLAVLRGDGALLAGSHATLPLGEAPPRPIDAARPGGASLQHLSDEQEHLVSHRNATRYDVKVVVSRPLSAVLAEWRASRTLAVIGLLTLLVVMSAGVQLGLNSARRRADAQIQSMVHVARIRRLDALVSLAQGVAHDFNAVLTGILGWGSMAREAVPRSSQQAHQLDNVLRAAERGRSLVDRMLAFSRNSHQAPRAFEVEPVVREVLELLGGSRPPAIVFEVALESPGAMLSGDPNLVFEALVNLCTNAIQAMPHGGRIVVSLTRHAATAPRMLSHGRLPAGQYLLLAVSDEGPGVPDDAMDRLFEPYFTTRHEPQGHGLGLAVVHGVVTELQGAIDVSNGPGMGARFALYLPELCSVANIQPQR